MSSSIYNPQKGHRRSPFTRYLRSNWTTPLTYNLDGFHDRAQAGLIQVVDPVRHEGIFLHGRSVCIEECSHSGPTEGSGPGNGHAFGCLKCQSWMLVHEGRVPVRGCTLVNIPLLRDCRGTTRLGIAVEKE